MRGKVKQDEIGMGIADARLRVRRQAKVFIREETNRVSYHWAKRPLGLRHFAQQMEVISHQRIGQDPYAAKGLQRSHQ